jgi:predicted transcriptional regulator
LPMELPTRQELDQLAQELWKERYALPTRRQATEQELECVLWLAPDLLARLEKAAAAKGVTPADFARNAVVECLEREKE